MLEDNETQVAAGDSAGGTSDTGTAGNTVAADSPATGAAAADTGLGEWSGQVDTLDKEEWYTKLDEPVRTAIKGGVSKVARSLQGDYTKKTQDLAKQRAEAEVSLRAAAEKEARALRLLYGEEDPFKDSESRTAALTAEHKKIVDGLLADFEKKLAEAERAKAAAVDAVTKDRDNAAAKVAAYERAAGEAEKAAVKARTEETYKKLVETAPDIDAKDEAFDEFVRLLSVYDDFDKAVKLTRVSFPLPEKAKEPPAGVALMNLGGSANVENTASEPENFFSLFENERRKAQSEYGESIRR